MYIYDEYLAHFLLEWELFQKSCKENQNTHFMFNIYFFRKSCRVWDNVEKCGRAGEATGDSNDPMCIVYWITKATDTHSEYYLLLFHNNNCYAKELQCFLDTYIACLF